MGLAAATAPAAPPPHGNVRSAAESEVLAAERQFSARSAEVGAAQAWREFFDEREGHLFGATGDPAIGAEAVYNAMGGSAPAPATITWKTEKLWVARSGDLATTWGRWISKRPDGSARTGRYVTTWRRNEKGEWKVLIDIGNSDPPPAPAPAPPAPTGG